MSNIEGVEEITTVVDAKSTSKDEGVEEITAVVDAKSTSKDEGVEEITTDDDRLRTPGKSASKGGIEEGTTDDDRLRTPENNTLKDDCIEITDTRMTTTTTKERMSPEKMPRAMTKGCLLLLFPCASVALVMHALFTTMKMSAEMLG